MADREPLTLRERLRMWLRLLPRSNFARKSIHAAVRLSRPPMASLVIGPQKSGGQQFRIMSFDSLQTERMDDNCVAAGANFRSSLFYLAATIRAVHRVLERRGCRPAAYVVPVPIDSRKRGRKGPVIGNHVTFLFYRVEPEEVATIKGLVKSLMDQMMEQIRDRIPESFTTMMELFRNLPLDLLSLQVAGPTKGQIGSFFFSCPGEVCADLDFFLDVPVKEVLHLPPVSIPPGLSVIFSRRNGGLSVVISMASGCMDSEEVELLEDSLRAELLNAI